MHPFRTCARAPRAHIDPIRCAADAIALFAVAVAEPFESEVLGIVLDDAGFGHAIVTITDVPPSSTDAVLRLADILGTAAEGAPSAAGMVLATVRPDGELVQATDVDTWLEASAIADDHGLRLLEWFVVGPDGIECPRDLLGEPERW
jgi:hypothetical protein